MRRLLSANLHRLWRTPSFWITVALFAFLEAALSLLLLRQGVMPLEFAPYFALQAVGVLTAVFYSLFLGTEYSDGTIRNKLIVGHRRHSVYLASLATGAVAVTVLCLVGTAAGCAIGLALGAQLRAGTAQLAQAAALSWLSCISYTALFNLVGLLSSSKARTAMICILTAFCLFFAGLTCYSLNQSGIFSGAKQALCQFLFDFNPFGQTFQVLSVDGPTLWKLSGYALLLTLLLTGVGLGVFRKKDLK